MVAGKYRLERLLGRGGMGSVWEGVHAEIGTRVALKFIEAEFAHHPEVRDRFFNEALAAARLRSKHIVQVYDSGVDDGRPYIVMEFLSGEPLDERLVREGTLTLSDAAAIVTQLSRAMKKAHAAGIVHRDLKPENVYLVWDEEDRKDVVKVVDFGIAKFTDRSDITSATRTGAVLGTPHFMSPEQARGLKGIDGRADVWSIGVIAYRAVTGALPFDGEAIGDLLVKICTTEPKAPSEHVPVPPAFDAWMQRSLEKDVTKRFANVEEQASALMAFGGADVQGAAGRDLEELPVSADPVPMLLGPLVGVERERVPTRKMPPLAVAALVSVAVLGAAAWFVLGAEPASESVEPAAASAPIDVERPSSGAPSVERSLSGAGPGGTDPAGADPARTDLVGGAATGAGTEAQGEERNSGGEAGETGTSADDSLGKGERAGPVEDSRAAKANRPTSTAARTVRKVSPPPPRPSHPRREGPKGRSGGAVQDELGY